MVERSDTTGRVVGKSQSTLEGSQRSGIPAGMRECFWAGEPEVCDLRPPSATLRVGLLDSPHVMGEGLDD